jgi:hypothetical protein
MTNFHESALNLHHFDNREAFSDAAITKVNATT